jgi:hypothetical protein
MEKGKEAPTDVKKEFRIDGRIPTASPPGGELPFSLEHHKAIEVLGRLADLALDGGGKVEGYDASWPSTGHRMSVATTVPKRRMSDKESSDIDLGKAKPPAEPEKASLLVEVLQAPGQPLGVLGGLLKVFLEGYRKR